MRVWALVLGLTSGVAGAWLSFANGASADEGAPGMHRAFPPATLGDAGALAEGAPLVDAAPVGVAAPRTNPGQATEAHEEPSAELPVATGFGFGVRGGWAFPLGTAHGGQLSNVVANTVFLGLDVGYFLNEHLYVGGNVFLGFPRVAGGANGTCNDPTLTCSANAFRFGATADWHFRPNRRLDPFAGAGIAYDILNETAVDEQGAQVLASSLHGFDLTLLGGLDFRVGSSFGCGPYVELATGHYASDSSATSLHSWLTFGLRLRTGL